MSAAATITGPPPSPAGPPVRRRLASAIFAWLGRRAFPLLAAVGLTAIGTASTVWWGPGIAHTTAWALPHDLWGTMIAANRLWHLHLGGLYTQPTGLVTLPGGALILVPIVAVIDAAGISLQVPTTAYSRPEAWLLGGPYMIAISCMVLLATDALAEHAGLSKPRRTALALFEAVALWGVSVQWGHPEDAVAVGLLLYAILSLARGKVNRSAWLAGAAIAVQPLVLLALPIIAAMIKPGRLPGYLTRAAVPSVVLLGAAAAANWHATFKAVTSQPNWPTVDHPSPWASLAPHLGNGSVAAGPARLVAIAAACACAIVVGRRWRAERDGAPWSSQVLFELLWWSALALALRSVFEPVMVAYYVWPVLALALIPATARWSRLIATGVVAGTITFASQVSWRGTWTWWTPMIAGVVLILFLARDRLALAQPSRISGATGR